MNQNSARAPPRWTAIRSEIGPPVARLTTRIPTIRFPNVCPLAASMSIGAATTAAQASPRTIQRADDMCWAKAWSVPMAPDHSSARKARATSMAAAEMRDRGEASSEERRVGKECH